ncbi:hypothetical protein AX14_001036 [Amanita brunnescens Koide BX004]|nr:hypothetical protein AX14_001036 [Amanita brunnescens Koide BX004]
MPPFSNPTPNPSLTENNGMSLHTSTIYVLTRAQSKHIARGTFVNNDNFSGSFNVPPKFNEREFMGEFTNNVPSFEAHMAEVGYNDIKDLFGTYEIEPGSVAGPDTLVVRLKNVRDVYITIKAEIEPPLNKSYPLKGRGFWLNHRRRN